MGVGGGRSMSVEGVGAESLACGGDNGTDGVGSVEDMGATGGMAAMGGFDGAEVDEFG